ncbi:hypothetical protein PMI13_01077 [Chryseobacterium populi]|uniref:Uncharacterized protein n=1 Tax=Chryseobacterium populi TaxID=1144316 RepID=J2KML5_9FLAO|nr:hypothetical protein PMI13_01077 [Chryseobacterium populi]
MPYHAGHFHVSVNKILAEKPENALQNLCRGKYYFYIYFIGDHVTAIINIFN